MGADSQLATFIITIVTGMVLGLLFDFYRVARLALRLGWGWTALADLLYWLVATALVFTGLLFGNWGEVRLYVFFGLAGGVICYYRLFSRWAVRLLTGLVHLVARLASMVRLTLYYCLVRPLRFLGRLVVRTAGFIGGRLPFRRPPPDEPGPPA